jgi:hypothetical protein
MEDDAVQAPPTITRRQRRGLGASLAVVGLLGTIGLLAASCGGGSKDPGTASAASTSTTTTIVAPSGSSGSGSAQESSQTEELQFAQCMRSHGISDFPDPSGGGLLNAISAAGVNTQSPTYQAAEQACEKYSPAGHLTPTQSAAASAAGLEFSQCMRSHGVPNFPDPSTGPTGGQAINLHGLDIDPSSPTYQSANAACQKIVPGSK